VFSRLTRKKCPVCFRLSSGLKALVLKLCGHKIDCQKINQETHKNDRRVPLIDGAAPDCQCEKYRTSKYSPHAVEDSEALARFIFSPMHVNKKTGELKPSVFSHVSSNGCSIQRESIAIDDELLTFAKNFLAKEDRAWLGVLLGKCDDVRGIHAGKENRRAVCVYDTANSQNQAHGELCQTKYVMDDADAIELRHDLFEAFGKNGVLQPEEYRGGRVWKNLPQDIQDRPRVAKISIPSRSA
jgi:hypothetical protein